MNDVNFEEGLDVLQVWAIKRLALFIYPTSQLTPQLMILDTWAPSTCALCALCAAGRVQECSCHFLRHFTVLWHLISLHGGAPWSQCHDMSKTYSQAKYSDFEEVKGSSRFMKNPTRYYQKCAYSFLNVYHRNKILLLPSLLVSSKILEKKIWQPSPSFATSLTRVFVELCQREGRGGCYIQPSHLCFIQTFLRVYDICLWYILNRNSYDLMWVIKS